MAKEKFQSKSGFILASIGASVGLGNALRFPGLCASYGGGAFLLIYFVALVVLGVPVLNAEIALGRRFGGGAPNCLASVIMQRTAKFGGGTSAQNQTLKQHKIMSTPRYMSYLTQFKGFSARLGKGVGWASGINSVFTAFIYAGLAGWIISTAVIIAPVSISAPNLSDGQISGLFFDSVLCAREDGVISGFSLLVAAGIALAWLFMYFCLRGGAKSLSKAAKFTVIIPTVLLTVLAARGLMYNNSSQALAAVLAPELSAFSSPQIWLSALGQVFFSLSVAVGIMPAYGAYLPEGTNIFSCSLVIAAADFFVSVLASVVLFTTLYGCGLQSQIGSSGIITAFAVYPVAISRLFGGITALNAITGVLFYLSLAMMAVQSAVSMLEAFVSPFSAESGKPKKRIAGMICILGLPLTLIFATTAAPTAADISDRFVNFYNVLILGIAECLILALCDKYNPLINEINKFSRRLKMPKRAFGASVKFLCPAVLISLTSLEVFRLALNGLGYPLWVQLAFGWGLSLIIFVVPLILVKKYPPIYGGFKNLSPVI